jgi:hypothetical protein
VNKTFLLVAGDKDAVPQGACVKGPEIHVTSLAIAADGTAYGLTNTEQIEAIVPVPAASGLELSNKAQLELSADKMALVRNNDKTFRAAEVTTAPDLVLPANTNINIVAAKGVALRPGLRIAAGAPGCTSRSATERGKRQRGKGAQTTERGEGGAQWHAIAQRAVTPPMPMTPPRRCWPKSRR